MKFLTPLLGFLLYFVPLSGNCPVQLLHPEEILWEGDLDTSYMQMVSFEAQALGTEPSPYFLTFSLGGGDACSQRYLFNNHNERVPYQLYTTPNKEGMLLDMECGPINIQVLSGISCEDPFSDREYLYYYFSLSPWNQLLPRPGCYRDTVQITLYEGTLSQWTASYSLQEVSFVMWMPPVVITNISLHPEEAILSLSSNTTYTLTFDAPDFTIHTHPISQTSYKILWEPKAENMQTPFPYILCTLQINEDTDVQDAP